jgi:hypothetical protein
MNCGGRYKEDDISVSFLAASQPNRKWCACGFSWFNNVNLEIIMLISHFQHISIVDLKEVKLRENFSF